ncbi:MAG: proton-conducting membrane transporter [Firmicutes bacterium]|nr:proton-conducting membrane transporter [Bacillota bacterium]
MTGPTILIVILLPILGGALVPLLDFEVRRARESYVLAIVLATSVLAISLITGEQGTGFVLYHLTSSIDIAFRVDRLGSLFVLLVSILWPLSTLYAFEYMSHMHKRNRFFCFYTMSYGITLGVALSANLITMYLFYEMLTLATLPLITHEGTREAKVAGVKYLVYSIAGATAAFIGIIAVLVNGGSLEFSVIGLGSALTEETRQIFDIAFLFMFFGFGVKAAVFPLHGWLPTAGVAPTPVTALLHAVAVVKSGVFAIARVIYYTYDAAYLEGTAVQKLAMWFAAFTILYGSAMAWKELHFKKRLAYSTVSNLSYIVFALLLATPAGLQAGLLHMFFHGLMKIALFFVAGAVMHQSGRIYVKELRGFGKAMPVTFAVFTAASLALTGIPPFCGFLSKYAIATAAVAEGSVSAYLGVAALLLSAVFTALYLITIVVRAYFPAAEFRPESLKDVKEANAYMLVPLCLLAAAILLLGCFPNEIMNFIAGTLPEAFPNL